MPHTQSHLDFLLAGGEKRNAVFSDGAHRIRAGKSFSSVTEGRIARNVLEISHSCAGQRAYKRAARALGLPAHGAPMPEKLAEFFLLLLSEQGDLVADFMAGSCSFAAVAERHGRRWIATEVLGEYLRGAASRFERRPGFRIGSDLVEGLRDRLCHPDLDGQGSLFEVS